MAVEAVNGANQQQRTQHSVGAAVGTGIVTGLAGAGAGYLWGGAAARPTLKDVLEKDTVDFKNLEEKASEEQKTALNEIKTARESVTKKSGFTEELMNQKVKVGENEISYNEATAEANKQLKAYKAANKALAELPETATDAEKTAKQNAVNEAKEALDKARQTRKTVFDEVRKDKITKLAENESNKTAFEKVQKLFKKEIKGGKMALWAGIAAVVGLIAGYALSGKPAEAPQETQA